MTDSLRLLMTKRATRATCSFQKQITLSLFCSQKNKQITRKTDEQIPNPGWWQFFGSSGVISWSSSYLYAGRGRLAVWLHFLDLAECLFAGEQFGMDGGQYGGIFSPWRRLISTWSTSTVWPPFIQHAGIAGLTYNTANYGRCPNNLA